jgi:dipeptidyl aminopeptidase/acylaminoacyl peptidase
MLLILRWQMMPGMALHVYSQDGNYIAYKTHTIPGFEADRFRVAVYNTKHFQSETLTESFDYTTDNLSWSADSKSIYFVADNRGYSPVYKVDVQSKNIIKVTDDKSVRGYQTSKDEKNLYLTFTSVDKPSEIYSYDVNGSSYSQITFFNKKITEEVDIRPAEQMWVDGADGVPVHVFVVKPHGFEEYKKYPLGNKCSWWAANAMDGFIPWRLAGLSWFRLCCCIF